jgi:hypothetical protein
MSSKKFTCEGTLRQVLIIIICERHLPLLGFCLGWYSNFVGCDLVSVNSRRIWSTTEAHIPPPLHTVNVYTYSHREGEESLTRENVRGATVHNSGSKISA